MEKKTKKLDTLQKEAEKIAGILEGRLRYLIMGMENFSFYKAGEVIKGGYLCKFGHYFGAGVSREMCSDLEETVQREKGMQEKTVEHYDIRVYYDNDNVPKLVELSDRSISWAIRKTPEKREYKVVKGYSSFTVE